MKKTSLSIAAAAAVLIAGGSAGFASELPTYELTGFPISPVQAQVLGAANVHEQSRVSGSAVPHQLNVPTPRKKVATAIAPAPTTTGSSIR